MIFRSGHFRLKALLLTLNLQLLLGIPKGGNTNSSRYKKPGAAAKD